VAALGVLGMAGVVLAIAATPGGVGVASLARADVPARALGSPKLRRALLGAGRIALRPPSGDEPPTGCRDVEIVAGGDTAVAPPSAALAAPWRERLPAAPLLSLYVDPCHRQRLEANARQHGRAFEETGWLSFFEEGGLRFQGAVGVRAHGGASRRWQPISLRLYFGDRYGAGRLPRGALSPELAGDLEVVVLNRDEAKSRGGTRWLFMEAINYEVARRLGAPVPYTRPVALTLNGEAPRVMVLTERINGETLRQRFGHDDFEWMRIKGKADSADVAQRRELHEVIRRAPAPLTEEWAAARFDLDVLKRWTIAAMVCGTGEPFQALTFRDRSGRVAGGRWSWLLWDMDQSFFARFDFRRDPVAILFSRRHAWIPAGLLVRRLLNEDPGFRHRLGAQILAAMRDDLTPAFFTGLVERYRAQAIQLGVEDLEFLRLLDEFFRRRQLELPAEVGRHLLPT
jgi:CotH kinase protein